MPIRRWRAEGFREKKGSESGRDPEKQHFVALATGRREAASAVVSLDSKLVHRGRSGALAAPAPETEATAP